MSYWVRVRLGKRMRMTLHAAVESPHQMGLIVTIKMASVGQNVTVTIWPLRNHPG